MYFFKKCIIIILILVMISSTFSGCSLSSNGEYKISEENTTAIHENTSITFSSYDMEEETKVKIQKVEPQPLDTEEDLSEEIQITAYDFTVEDKEEFIDLIEISMPYDANFIENGENESNCVVAMYYNEDTKSWQPVEYSVDTESKTVHITTNHLSTYGVFQVARENSRAAKIIRINAAPKMPSSQLASEIVNECLNNQMTPGEKASEFGVSLMGDSLGISGAILTTFNEAIYSTQTLKNLGGYVTSLGLAGAFAQAAWDFHTGDDVALYGNLTKNLSYYSIGTWGSSALQLSFVGVYAVDYAINKFANEAWNGRNDIWYEAYKIYYEREAKRSTREWYKKFYWMWQDSIDGQNPGELSKQMNDALDEYCNQFWNLPEGDIAYYQSQAMDTGFSGGGGLNEDLKKEISKAKKAELVEVLQTPVFDRLETKIAFKLREDYYKKLNELKNELNQVVSIQIIEEVADGEKSKYGGYTIKFAPLSEDAIVKNWTGKMKEDGTASTKFTLLGHLQSGSPNTIELYPPDADPNTEEPEKVIQFKVNIPETTVEIKKYPPLEELVGQWNGSMIIDEIVIPEQEVVPESSEEGEESCDISPAIYEMLEELKGKNIPSIFNITATDENNGTLTLSTGEDVSDPIPFKYKEGRISVEMEEEGLKYKLDILAEYTNTGIKLDGYATYSSIEAGNEFYIKILFLFER
ncbi:MAG: hypothetical protein ACOWWH_04340 [Eubacteriaceae bacterium]